MGGLETVTTPVTPECTDLQDVPGFNMRPMATGCVHFYAQEGCDHWY